MQSVEPKSLQPPVFFLSFLQPTAVGEAGETLVGEWWGEQQILKLTDTRAATNVRPVENSLLPMSTTTLSRVRPWDLWMVTAHASLRES